LPERYLKRALPYRYTCRSGFILRHKGKARMKVFLKSLPIFISFVALEFVVYFFIYFCFSTDFIAIEFLTAFPLVLRIPILTAFCFSLIAMFISKDQQHFFLALTLNMVFLGIFFEIAMFKTLPNPFAVLQFALYHAKHYLIHTYDLIRGALGR